MAVAMEAVAVALEWAFMDLEAVLHQTQGVVSSAMEGNKGMLHIDYEQAQKTSLGIRMKDIHVSVL